jgi:hypothetical protein
MPPFGDVSAGNFYRPAPRHDEATQNIRLDRELRNALPQPRSIVTTMATEKNFGMRLAPHERRQIERLAKARETTMKDAVLEAVRRLLEEIEDEESFKPHGRLKGAEHLIGCFEGPEDLTTSDEYMKGYGE